MQYGMRYFQNISIKRTDSSIAGDSMNKGKEYENRIKKIISTVSVQVLLPVWQEDAAEQGISMGETNHSCCSVPVRDTSGIQEWKSLKKLVEEKLGDKYEVQIYPNELLGGQTKAIELTQTGAIDFVVAGTPNLEIFADVYEVFSMPYLFTSEEAYFASMNDTDYMEKFMSLQMIQDFVL